MNYSYKDLGLVNTAEMFRKAYEGGYTVPAFNFISIEQLNAIMDAVIEKNSPVILLASPNLHRQLGHEMIARIVQSGVDRITHEGLKIPVALHLDHGMTREQCVLAVENGFSSIMIDGSAKPFEENIALTKEVSEYAHGLDVTVEAELGILSGEEEGGSADAGEVSCESKYTDPLRAEEFIRRSGCDSLAVSVGTCHGLVKMKPGPDGKLPGLRFDILEHIRENCPGFPLVLHGASNIAPEYVEMINEHGGHIEQTAGIPDDQVRLAAATNVCKVNIATDGWICALAHTRRILDENPGAIDSRVFTLKTRPLLKELYLHKIDIMGSENRA